MFKIRPKLHLVTYYSVLPFFALAVGLMIFSFFGISKSFFYGTYFYIVVSAIMMSALALFEPFFSEITVTDETVSYLTSVGGEVKVNLSTLNYDETVWDETGLLIIDMNGNKIHISKLIFARSDISKVFDHLSEIS